MHKMPFSETILIEKFLLQNADHDRTYETAVEVPANITETEKLVRETGGVEYVVSTIITVPPDTAIQNEDRLTLPDGAHPVIVSISRRMDIPRKRVLYIEVNAGRVAQGEQSGW